MKRYFLSPDILYRKEAFGAVVFNKRLRQYSIFDPMAYSLLSIINENEGIAVEDLPEYVEDELVPDVEKLLDEWLLCGILGNEFYSTTYLERPSVCDKICKDIISFPLEVAINPTFICNQKCLFCSNEALLNKNIKELTKDDAGEFASRLFNLGVFKTYFVGGEPFLFKPLKFFIESLLAYNFDIGITTNGNFDNKDDLLFYAENKVFLSFSVQSHIESIHNSLTKNSLSFQRAVDNIKFLTNKRLPVDISIVLSSENQNSIEQTIEFFCKLGVKSITLLYPFDIGGVKKHQNLLISKTEFFQLAEQLTEAAKLRNVTLKTLGRMRFFYDPKYDPKPIKHNELFKKYFGSPGCFLCKKAIILHPNGDIYPCDFLMFEEKWKLGNIFDPTIVDSWENGVLIDSLRNMRRPELCSNCKYFQVCQGGCPATTYLATGKLSYPAADCPMLKEAL